MTRRHHEQTQRRPAPTHQDLPARAPAAPPEIYTLIHHVDGRILGALQAESGAGWIDKDDQQFRVARIDTPAHAGVPVVYVTKADADRLADPSILPPDVFSGMPGEQRIRPTDILAHYHRRTLADAGKIAAPLKARAPDAA